MADDDHEAAPSIYRTGITPKPVRVFQPISCDSLREQVGVARQRYPRKLFIAKDF